MCWHYFRWAIDLCVDPQKNTKKTLDYFELLKRLWVVSLLPAIVITIFLLVFMNIVVPIFGGVPGPMSALYSMAWIAIIPAYLIAVTIVPFIVALVLHMIGKFVFKSIRKKYDKTYNAVAQSLSPMLLFGWIPVVGNLASGWTFVTLIYALANQHGIRNMRALTTVLVSSAALILVALLLFAPLILLQSSFV